MDKLKVILIDDEMLIRKLIRMKMDVEGLGLELVGEYSNGASALEDLNRVRPDIVVSDICMPEEDGLSFSEKCVERFPNTKIIIVTGYDDFHYARRSIKAGVFDYLMKPIQTEELNGALKKASDEIRQAMKKEERQRQLWKDIEKNLPVLRDIYINQIMMGDETPKDMEKDLERYGIPIKKGEGYGIKVGILTVKESFYQPELVDRIQEEANVFFQSDKDLIVVKDSWHRIVMIVCSKKVPFEECLDIFISMLKKKMDCSLNIGISDFFSGWENLQAAYVCALDNMQSRRGDKTKIAGSQDACQERWSRLTGLVRDVRLEEAREAAVHICLDTKADIGEIRRKIMAGCQKMYIDLEQNQVSVIFHKELEWCCTLEQLKHCLDSIVTELIVRRKMERSYQYTDMMGQVLKYVEENVEEEELGLSLLAEKFSVSSSHLSRVLKQFTGKNYGEIVSDIRLLRMFELMNTTDMKDCDIGGMIGISDAHYLSIWFRKITGCSVTEYRKKISERAE